MSTGSSGWGTLGQGGTAAARQRSPLGLDPPGLMLFSPRDVLVPSYTQGRGREGYLASSRNLP